MNISCKSHQYNEQWLNLLFVIYSPVNTSLASDILLIIFAVAGDCPGDQEEGRHGDAAASLLWRSYWGRQRQLAKLLAGHLGGDFVQEIETWRDLERPGESVVRERRETGPPAGGCVGLSGHSGHHWSLPPSPRPLALSRITCSRGSTETSTHNITTDYTTSVIQQYHYDTI